MPERTPAEDAYALDNRLSRDDLRPEARAEYDRLFRERYAAALGASADDLPVSTSRIIPTRSSPEVRARLLQLIKQANPKYAKPFEQDRIAAFSLMAPRAGPSTARWCCRCDPGHAAARAAFDASKWS
jgi:hypothetical protein